MDVFTQDRQFSDCLDQVPSHDTEAIQNGVAEANAAIVPFDCAPIIGLFLRKGTGELVSAPDNSLPTSTVRPGPRGTVFNTMMKPDCAAHAKNATHGH